MYNKEVKLFVFSAPSGAGKTTIARGVVKLCSVVISVSYTTRLPHTSEIEGVDYQYVTQEQFRNLQDSGEFLEYAKVHGNWYATSKTWVENMLLSGKSVLLKLDTAGSKQIKKFALPSVHVFILPPSIEILEARLQNRARDEPKNIQLRLENAHTEIAKIVSYDYIIVNHDYDLAVQDALSIINNETGVATSKDLAQRMRALKTSNNTETIEYWYKFLAL